MSSLHEHRGDDAFACRGTGSAAALQDFRRLVADWNLRHARVWTMLTGEPSVPRTLTDDQAWRVALLTEMDAVMGGMVDDVGAWMVAPNPSALLNGSSPADFLTAMGTPGYGTLLRQVQRWARAGFATVGARMR